MSIECDHPKQRASCIGVVPSETMRREAQILQPVDAISSRATRQDLRTLHDNATNMAKGARSKLVVLATTSARFGSACNFGSFESDQQAKPAGISWTNALDPVNGSSNYVPDRRKVR